jgi:septum formation protein
VKPSKQKLILASASPFRRGLLQSCGLEFEVETSRVDESQIHASSPENLALARARAKALDVAARNEQAVVIGCDQVLGMGNLSYDKATSREEARQRLNEFSGKSHFLYSAIVLATRVSDELIPKISHEIIVPVEMKMRALCAAEIESYLDTEEWQGCVGCYRFESVGVHLFDTCGGDHSSIIGLPLLPLLAALRQLGIRRL